MSDKAKYICGIHRVEKRKITDVFGIEIEANRTPEILDKYDFLRSDIHPELTDSNIHFIKSNNFRQSIKNEIAKAGIEKIRKDAVVLLDGLYTASPEFFEKKTEEEMIGYFQDCFLFHEKYYGHIINAVIHLDETTPHMQVASVPLIRNDENSPWRLSASDIMGNKKAYSQRQDAFYEEVTKKYGLDRGQIRDAEHQRNHLSVQEFKLKEVTEELEYKEGRILTAKDITELSNKKKKRIAKTYTITEQEMKNLLRTTDAIDNIEMREREAIRMKEAFEKAKKENEEEKKWFSKARDSLNERNNNLNEEIHKKALQVNVDVIEFHKLKNENQVLKGKIKGFEQFIEEYNLIEKFKGFIKNNGLNKLFGFVSHRNKDTDEIYL